MILYGSVYAIAVKSDHNAQLVVNSSLLLLHCRLIAAEKSKEIPSSVILKIVKRDPAFSIVRFHFGFCSVSVVILRWQKFIYLFISVIFFFFYVSGMVTVRTRKLGTCRLGKPH